MTIRTMNTTARFFHDGNAQNLCHINQRKGRCFIQTSSADEDNKNDDYDSRSSHDRMPKICFALNKEKDIATLRQ